MMTKKSIQKNTINKNAQIPKFPNLFNKFKTLESAYKIQSNSNIQMQSSDIGNHANNPDPTQISSQQNFHQASSQNLQPILNADSQQASKIWVPRIITIILCVVILLLVFALPPTFGQITNDVVFSGSTNPKCNMVVNQINNTASCQQFSSTNPEIGLLLPYLKLQNQFLIFYFDIQVAENNVATVKINQQAQLVLYEVQIGADYTQLDLKNKFYNQTHNITIQNLKDYKPSDFQQISPSPSSSSQKLRKYRISFAYTRIPTPSYTILTTIKLSNQSQISPLYNIDISSLTINPQYTIFTIVIRAIYLIVSVITGGIYLWKFCRLDREDRIFQTKIVAIGSVMLMGFNDPLYALTVLKVNPVSTFFSCFVAVNMLLLLNFWWVFMLRRIFYQTEQKQSQLLNFRRSWPFYLFFLALYSTIMALFTQYSYYILYRTPVITGADLQPMRVAGTIFVLIVLLVTILVYQAVMFIRIIVKVCRKEDNFNPLLARHCNFLVYYPFFLAIFVAFFMMGGTMPYSMQGAWVLYGYSFLNIYTFMMQYCYYPIEAVQFKLQQSTDNKADKNRGNNSFSQKLQQNSETGQKGQSMEISSDYQQEVN